MMMCEYAMPQGVKCDQGFIDPTTLLPAEDPVTFNKRENIDEKNINSYFASFFLLISTKVTSSKPQKAEYRKTVPSTTALLPLRPAENTRQNIRHKMEVPAGIRNKVVDIKVARGNIMVT